MDKRKAHIKTTPMFSQGKRKKRKKREKKENKDIKERINQ